MTSEGRDGARRTSLIIKSSLKKSSPFLFPLQGVLNVLIYSDAFSMFKRGMTSTTESVKTSVRKTLRSIAVTREGALPVPSSPAAVGWSNDISSLDIDQQRASSFWYYKDVCDEQEFPRINTQLSQSNGRRWWMWKGLPLVWRAIIILTRETRSLIPKSAWHSK